VNIKPLVFLACTTLAVAYIFLSAAGSHPLVRQGSTAPEFTLTDLDGREASLSDFRGNVVFLNFWRTDCLPCAAEMPDMEILQKKFKGRKFQMMPVSLDVDAGDVASFYEEHNLTMPAYLDPGANVASRYATTGVPETFLIDTDGTITRYYFGKQPWASSTMLAQLDQMIPQ